MQRLGNRRCGRCGARFNHPDRDTEWVAHPTTRDGAYCGGFAGQIPQTWRYRGVTIERSRVTGFYLANTSRGLTADTLAGMRELIREYPAID